VKISFENHWIISSFIHADGLPTKCFPEEFIPKLAEALLKMRGIPIMRDKPIVLIKR
jgi:hypothetical protein